MSRHLDDDHITIRSLLQDFVAACAAGAFVWAVCIWLPYIAQHH